VPVPRLIITGGPLVGRRHELGDDFTIADQAVVRASEGTVVVEDLGAPGGVWVDGRRIADRAALVDGTQLQVGDTTCIVEIDAVAGQRTGVRPVMPTAPANAADRQWTQPKPVTPPPDAAERQRTQPRLVIPGPPARPYPPQPYPGQPQQPYPGQPQQPYPGQPQQPYSAPPIRRRRRADTRLWLPAAATFATIIATAAALVVYFALR
jgi:hypothetical protein